MTDAERALALHEFVVRNVRSWALPNAAGNSRPMQILNVYGYCNCGGFARATAALAAVAGMKSRVVGLPGHVVAEVFYDDAWHLFDGSANAVYRKPDGTLASVEEVHGNLKLLDNVKHRVHAPDGAFTEEGIRRMYEQGPSGFQAAPSGEQLHKIAFALHPEETIVWYRDERAKFYPFQNREFMSRPPIGYFASGTLIYRPQTGGEHFAGRWGLGSRADDLSLKNGVLSVSKAGRIQRLRMKWKLPWAVLGGRVRIAGYRTPDEGTIRMFLHRPDRRIQFVAVTTDQPDYDEAFDTVLHFDRVAVQPPPNPVLFDVDLELALFKVRPESRLELRTIEVEIDVQRSPQSLPPAELDGRSLVYRDKGQQRKVRVVLD
jgi:hypothetical protein